MLNYFLIKKEAESIDQAIHENNSLYLKTFTVLNT